jgi:CAAX prenyl protease-like protein
MGKAHWPVAIVVGVLVAAGWVVGQHFFNDVHIAGRSLGGRLFFFPGTPDVSDPRVGLSAWSWGSQVVLRIAVASITVPMVEELFWRGFLLRAMIDWDRFERVPLGTFTWFSFLGTSLLSMFEHPDNWAVSILCWFAYNGLMYWKKSLLCLMIAHGITNLVFYVYVIYAGDWMFW